MIPNTAENCFLQFCPATPVSRFPIAAPSISRPEAIRAILASTMEIEKFGPLSETLSKTIQFRDKGAGVWIATSDADRITTEAATKQEVIDRLTIIVPDVLESRSTRAGHLTILIDWQDLKTVEQTAFALT